MVRLDNTQDTLVIAREQHSVAQGDGAETQSRILFEQPGVMTRDRVGRTWEGA